MPRISANASEPKASVIHHHIYIYSKGRLIAIGIL